MTDQQAPEYPSKIWLDPRDIETMKWSGLIETVEPERPWEQQEYARFDLLEAAEKRIKELEAENSNLRNWVDHHATEVPRITAERDQALAASAAREIAMRDRAAGVTVYEGLRFDGKPCYYHTPDKVKAAIHALPLSPDGQQALKAMLADAWDDGRENGWKFGRHARNPYRKDEG